MKLRAKALDAMMGEDQPLTMGKQPMALEAQEGLESMMVTPEEKAMIMQLRGEPMGSDIGDDDDEAPGQILGG